MPFDQNEHLSLLKDALQSLMPQLQAGLSEFDLISILKNKPYRLLSADALSDSLFLFQTHFVLFHALYQLRTQWRSAQTGELEISASLIKLHSVTAIPSGIAPNGTAPSGTAAIQNTDPLAEYYLDWDNLANTDEASVEEMLSSFWLKMAGYDAFCAYTEEEIAQAKAILELPVNTLFSAEQLKQQYRKLQHKHHPDKGGSVEQSQQLVNAYTCLQQHLQTQESLK